MRIACIPIRAVWKFHFPYPFVTAEVHLEHRKWDTAPRFRAWRRGSGRHSLGALAKATDYPLTHPHLPQVSQDGPVFDVLVTAAQTVNLPFIVHYPLSTVC